MAREQIPYPVFFILGRKSIVILHVPHFLKRERTQANVTEAFLIQGYIHLAFDTASARAHFLVILFSLPATYRSPHGHVVRSVASCWLLQNRGCERFHCERNFNFCVRAAGVVHCLGLLVQDVPRGKIYCFTIALYRIDVKVVFHLVECCARSGKTALNLLRVSGNKQRGIRSAHKSPPSGKRTLSARSFSVVKVIWIEKVFDIAFPRIL